VAQFLAVENHSFTEETNTVLVHLQACRAGGAQTLPALPPPSLLQGDVGGVLVCWEPVSLAAAYKVEIRTAGAGSWSPVDAIGRVQPAGAESLLGLQSTCLAICGLSAGLPYEARVSYVASCGCRCSPSDPSCPCSIPVMPASAHPPVPCAPVPRAPEMAPVMQLQAPQVQQVPPPPPMPRAPEMAPMMQQQAPVMILTPPQPEVHLSNVANAISVRWSTVGFPAAGYVVELREGSTSVSSRCACQAPTDGAVSLELCIQGLQPGQSYVACVRSVAQDGFESVPSPWSCWVTLPHMMPAFECGNASMAHMSPPAAQQQPMPHVSPPAAQQQLMSPYSILFDEVSMDKTEKNQFGMVKACPPPEITGHEDAIFLD